LAIGILFLGLAIFFSLQYSNNPRSEESATEANALAGSGEDQATTPWQGQPVTVAAGQNVPFLNTDPNEMGINNVPAEPAIFSSLPKADSDQQKPMFNFGQPTRISDKYHPLLPFRMAESDSDIRHDLVPIQPKRTFDSYESQQFRLHTVRDGDTLQSIAREYFGSANRYLEIYSLNKSILTDPGKMPLGKQLKIPAQ